MSHRELVKGVLEGNIKVVADIIAKGAEGLVDFREPKVTCVIQLPTWLIGLVSLFVQEGWMLIHLACKTGNIEMVKMLYKCGASMCPKTLTVCRHLRSNLLL